MKRFLLIVIALAACKKDAAPTAPPDNGGGDPVADPYACTADEDCVAVELQCCDACNGGEAVGVHRDHAEAVRAESPAATGGCDDVACTLMACAPWEASCEAGKCTLARGAFE